MSPHNKQAGQVSYERKGRPRCYRVLTHAVYVSPLPTAGQREDVTGNTPLRAKIGMTWYLEKVKNLKCRLYMTVHHTHTQTCEHLREN